MEKILLIIISIFLLLPFSLGAKSNQNGLASSPCPMFKCNLKHTGQTPVETNISSPKLKWKFDAGNGIEVMPTIGQDGTIYFGTFKDNFYALNPDGSVKWQFNKPGEEFRSTATVAEDGTIYFGAVFDTKPVYNQLHNEEMDTGVPKVYALNPDGTIKWEFITGGVLCGTYDSPVVGPDGTIYMGAGASKLTDYAEGGDRLWAINPDGTEKWYFETEEAIFTIVAIADDGTIYLAGAEGVFYAINPDGTEKWRFEKRDGYFDSSPTIGPDGTIYFGSTDKNLYALTPEGEEKWTFTVNDILEAPPSIGLDGTIYTGVIDQSESDTNLYAINPDGTEKWRFETGGGVFATPTIDANGTLFFGSYDGNLYSLNPDGTERWHYTTQGGVTYPPTISEDGTIYFGSWDNYLYAVTNESNIGNILQSDNQNRNTVIITILLVVVLVIVVGVIIYFKKRNINKNI